MRTLLLLCAGAFTVTACAPSPYYVGGLALTPGEVPRDAYGEPVLSAMEMPPGQPEMGSGFADRRAAGIPEARPLPTSPDRPL